jgi:putative MATE family efflux protein
MKEQKSRFYSLLFGLAIPIFFTQLLGSLLGIIDTFMVSSLGDEALAAVGIGSQFMMLLFMIQFGLMSGFGIYIAQYFGAKDFNNISRTYILALSIGLSISLVFLLFAQITPTGIIKIFNLNESPNTNVIELGKQYIKIVSFSFLMSTISFSISMLGRSVHKVVVVSIIQGAGVVLNTFLNYVLINGHFGVPSLGVQGAAIATTTSNALMMVASIIFLLSTKEKALHIHFSYIKDLNRTFVSKVMKTVFPVVINESFWGFAMTMYFIAYGMLGEKQLGSIYLSNQINSIFWVATIAVANAATAMLGKKLGENDLQTAKEWSTWFGNIAVGIGIVVGLILFVFAPFIVNLFGGITIEVRETVKIILKIYALYAPIKFVNVVYVVGTLRAGGDTKYALFSDLGALWLYGVPLAFILAAFSSFSLPLIVALVNIEELIKLFLVFFRVRSGKWINNLADSSI